MPIAHLWKKYKFSESYLFLMKGIIVFNHFVFRLLVSFIVFLKIGDHCLCTEKFDSLLMKK